VIDEAELSSSRNAAAATETAQKRCGEEKQQLRDTVAAAETAEKRCGEEKQQLRDKVGELNQRVQQLESSLEDERQKVLDKNMIAQRLSRQVQQLKYQMSEIAKQQAANAPDQSPAQSHGLPRAMETGFSDTGVPGSQKKDQGEPRARRTRDQGQFGRMEVTTSQTGVHREGFAGGRAGEVGSAALLENARGGYGSVRTSRAPETVFHQAMSVPRHERVEPGPVQSGTGWTGPSWQLHQSRSKSSETVSQQAISSSRVGESFQPGPSPPVQSGTGWTGPQWQRPQSSMMRAPAPRQHMVDSNQTAGELPRQSASGYERRSWSRHSDQPLLLSDNSSLTLSGSSFPYRRPVHQQREGEKFQQRDFPRSSQGLTQRGGESEGWRQRGEDVDRSGDVRRRDERSAGQEERQDNRAHPSDQRRAVAK